MSKLINFIEYNPVDGNEIYIGLIDDNQIYKVMWINKRHHWVAFDNDNNIVDKDMYRYDLFERLELKERWFAECRV